jgi:hypothetical protein
MSSHPDQKLLTPLWAKRILVRRAMRSRDEPGAADLEVDGDDEAGSWDEPATSWMEAKKAAVRRFMACNMNEVGDLPAVGARVTRIVLQEGVGHLYFEDGSFVAFSHEDLMPKEGPPCGSHSRAAAFPAAVDMVAAVRGNELLGAMDARRRGARDVRFWAVQVGSPFDLFELRGVPMREATLLNDFGSRSTRLPDGRRAWALGRRFADSRPFRRAR